MTDDEELREIAYDALRELYDEAEPGLNFDDVLENPDEYSEHWYENHHLNKDRQREIVEQHCDKHNLNQSETNSVFWTAVLDLGPQYTPLEDD